MSAGSCEISVGAELVSPPYLLDAAAATGYRDGLEQPPRQGSRGNIHDDKDAARKAGFVEPIAGGEQTIAIVAQFLADTYGLRFIRGGRIEVTLTRPVFYGDTLISHAKILSIDMDRVHLQIHVENQRGEHVLIGSASIRISNA